jgi:hypothetical protein
MIITDYYWFKDYIYEISKETINNLDYYDTSWLQQLVPNTILNEEDAIKYVFNHQWLIWNLKYKIKAGDKVWAYSADFGLIDGTVVENVDNFWIWVKSEFGIEKYSDTKVYKNPHDKLKLIEKLKVILQD